LTDNLQICVDSNEASSRKDIVNYFRLAGFQVNIQKLDVCDYVVSDRCGVERKDTTDFLSSMRDGRLFSQAGDMVRVYEKPILVLEGSLSRAFKRSRMRPSSVYGALASLTLDYGISVIPTESPESTSILLHRLAFREQIKQDRPVQIRSVRRDLPPHQQQIFLLSGLPQIGTILAEELLNQFDTPFNVLQEFASAEIIVSKSGKTKRLGGPISNVRGVGPLIVEQARNILNQSYQKLCELNIE
jgi:Fanconi anemia group M protein